MPAVSIVIPLHDAAGTVVDTLASVFAQDWEDWELIVVDDASADDGPAVVEARCQGVAQPVTVLASRTAAPEGPAAARNRGLAAADGDLVSFLDADDLWDPGFLSHHVTILHADRDVGLSWGPVHYWYQNDPGADFVQPTGLGTEPVRLLPRAPIAGWLTDLRTTPCPSATVFRRAALVTVGGYPGDLRRGEDIAACILVAADHPTAHDPSVLTRYRRHDQSATSRAHMSGQSAAEDVEFARWALRFVRSRPDLERLGPIALRVFHGLAHRSTVGRLRTRWRTTRTVLGEPGARSLWWAVALDWFVPLRWSRRIVARAQRPRGERR